ncbi:hypothetical protein EDB81DRAFT_769699 [Dactylonectria macrodidyma]|uniref:Zn(2)-C6 fungal-type domain-containing protein n=1 Tax=Dactylonectria macrodidyma TaxID=307937 RepID=A0A9P9FSS9_9HYPO|nr:hypothetical protein EDB81DRAFT_769699 [Dactylonectria macrodidyma]
MTKVKPHQRKRAWAPKTQSGCKTCRVRRVKCDETTPVCSKCFRGGYKCEGLAFSDSRLPHERCMVIRSPRSSLTLLSSGDDSRTFDFFLANGVSMLSNGSRCEFWEGLVVQIAHVNAAIFRSVVALSTLLEDFSRWKMNFGAGFQAPANEKTKSALKHYGLALRQTSAHLRGSESMNIFSLTSCLLFCYIECLLGNVPASAKLATAGLTILSQAESARVAVDSPGPLRCFWPLFTRIDSFFIQLRRILAPDYRPPSTFLPIRTMPSSFSNIGEATFHLELLVNASQRLCGSSGDESARIQSLEAYRTHFVEWNAAFQQLASHHELADESMRRSLCLCHIWRLHTQLNLFGPQDGSHQVEWDSHEQSFRELLSYASTFSELDSGSGRGQLTSFSLGGGIFFPLSGLALRCRDPTMRRSAASLLLNHSRAEGPLWGPIAARLFDKFVTIEEQGLSPVTSSSDVPEWARIISPSARLRGKGNGADISYARLMDLNSGERITVHDIVL